MKQIAAHLSGTTAQREHRTTDTRRASALIARLSVIWPFLAKRLEDPAILDLTIAEWAQAIEDLSDDQILQGIERCRNELRFPPSVAEFLEAATRARPPAHRIVQRDRQLAAGTEEERRERASKNLQALREARRKVGI